MQYDAVCSVAVWRNQNKIASVRVRIRNKQRKGMEKQEVAEAVRRAQGVMHAPKSAM